MSLNDGWASVDGFKVGSDEPDVDARRTTKLVADEEGWGGQLRCHG